MGPTNHNKRDFQTEKPITFDDVFLTEEQRKTAMIEAAKKKQSQAKGGKGNHDDAEQRSSVGKGKGKRNSAGGGKKGKGKDVPEQAQAAPAAHRDAAPIAPAPKEMGADGKGSPKS